MDFATFDTRKYPVLSVSEGYQEWASSYEQTVDDEMDLRLLNLVQSVSFGEVDRAIDLACGTGRTGVWMKSHGVLLLDGVDLTLAMIDVAREKGVYENLKVADVADTGLDSQSYSLSVLCLADEHFPTLAPFYAEAFRLTRSGGHLVLVGFHPFFLMMGISAHFKADGGSVVSVESYVHLLSDHFKAGVRAGWKLVEMEESVIDDAWIRTKPQWEKYRGRPVSFLMVWERGENVD